MANKKLQNKKFPVPSIYKSILGKDISYENLKKYKHKFDNINMGKESDKELFKKIGGYPIKKFVDDTLKKARKSVEHSHNQKKDSFETTNDLTSSTKDLGKINKISKNDINPMASRRLKDDYITESEIKTEAKKRAALAIVENEEGKYLLLKRNKKDTFRPSHWGYVGGGIEDSDMSEEYALKREIIEETMIDVNNIKLLKKRLHDDTLCFIFTCKTKEIDPLLNNEHEDYGWYSLNEIKKIKAVEGVYEDIKEYEKGKKIKSL